MIEWIDAATAADVVTEGGPSTLILGFIVWVSRGLPKLVSSATAVLAEVTVSLRRWNRVMSLGERWLEQQVGKDKRESGDFEALQDLADGATDEQVLAHFESLDPTDSVPIRLARYGKVLTRAADELKKRKREASGPRRAAQ